MGETRFKQICKCKNCGNEAEMEVTCTLEAEAEADAPPAPRVVPEKEGKVKGHAVCSHCGGEADIWLDV